MSDAKSPSDLEMEELLAEIRRMISEDERTPASASSNPDNASMASGSRTADNTEDDLLELTRALNEDGSVRQLAPIGASMPRAPHPSEPPPAAEAAEAAPEREPERREAPRPEAHGAGDAGLVSDAASFAAAAAFTRLATEARELRPAHAPPLVGDRLLEDMVEGLLRPLLQTWLDENLPPIVERLVQAEIARIVRKSGAV